jgi:hypothetical protein
VPIHSDIGGDADGLVGAMCDAIDDLPWQITDRASGNGIGERNNIPDRMRHADSTANGAPSTCNLACHGVDGLRDGTMRNIRYLVRQALHRRKLAQLVRIRELIAVGFDIPVWVTQDVDGHCCAHGAELIVNGLLKVGNGRCRIPCQDGGVGEQAVRSANQVDEAGRWNSLSVQQALCSAHDWSPCEVTFSTQSQGEEEVPAISSTEDSTAILGEQSVALKKQLRRKISLNIW